MHIFLMYKEIIHIANNFQFHPIFYAENKKIIINKL